MAAKPELMSRALSDVTFGFRGFLFKGKTH
jgi:hypothetical protein